MLKGQPFHKVTSASRVNYLLFKKTNFEKKLWESGDN